jgi:hypothetical protein
MKPVMGYGKSKPAGKKPAKSSGGSSAGGEKTANWPSNPGPTQKKDRGLGMPKIKNAMMEDC